MAKDNSRNTCSNAANPDPKKAEGSSPRAPALSEDQEAFTDALRGELGHNVVRGHQL